MAIDFQTFLKAEERIEHNWEEAESGMQSALISQVWDSVVPHLRQRANEEGISAEEYHRRVYLTRRILRELCFALHSGGLYAETKPKRFWSHQVVDPIRANDKSRGIEIDTAELCGVAAQYVSQPELQNDATDWLFMDSLVFAELDAFAYQLMSGIGSVNWAFILAGGKQIQYYLYAVSLPVLGFVVRYLAPLALLGYLIVNERGTTAIVIAVVWLVYLVLRMISFPERRRATKKSLELLQLMIDAYSHLGSSVISPVRFIAAIDKATKSGVVFDGALFAIADRVMKRDATGFVPFRR